MAVDVITIVALDVVFVGNLDTVFVIVVVVVVVSDIVSMNRRCPLYDARVSDARLPVSTSINDLDAMPN